MAISRIKTEGMSIPLLPNTCYVILLFRGMFAFSPPNQFPGSRLP